LPVFANERATYCSPVPPGSVDVGVPHPVASVADVRCPDARSRERDRPEGVGQGFHVILNKVDPEVDRLARNLLSKDDWRPALLDEPMP
jgi:hypothetical protein